MSTQTLGIIMHGVTGRMGTNQHLIRSICAIRAQGGVALSDGRRVLPDPILVGRNADKLETLARAHGVARWTTDLGAAPANPADTVYFDPASTGLRPRLRKWWASSITTASASSATRWNRSTYSPPRVRSVWLKTVRFEKSACPSKPPMCARWRRSSRTRRSQQRPRGPRRPRCRARSSRPPARSRG